MLHQNDQFHSEVLGVDISIHDTKLQLIDSRTGNEVLTGEEFERQARIAAEAKSERIQAELDQLRKQQKG